MTEPLNIPRLGGATIGLRPAAGQSYPIGVGTAFQMRMIILGFEARATAAFTEWDPPHAYAFSGKGAGFRSISLRETHEAAADATKVVTVVEVEPGPVLKLLWPIFGPRFRRRLEASTRNIKRLLEAD